MSQQSLFDNLVAEDDADDGDDAPKRRTPSPTPGNSAKSDPNIWETTSEYMRRKRQEELLERQERKTLHEQATRQIGEEGKMYCLLWATSDEAEDLDEECRRAAFGVKNRIKSLLHAKKQNTDPGDPDHIGLGDSWPYDDERPPEWHTRPADYRRYLVGKWFRDWRHLIPTDVLNEAIETTDMPHL